jgi:hypothetical protein
MISCTNFVGNLRVSSPRSTLERSPYQAWIDAYPFISMFSYPSETGLVHHSAAESYRHLAARIPYGPGRVALRVQVCGPTMHMHWHDASTPALLLTGSELSDARNRSHRHRYSLTKPSGNAGFASIRLHCANLHQGDRHRKQTTLLEPSGENPRGDRPPTMYNAIPSLKQLRPLVDLQFPRDQLFKVGSMMYARTDGDGLAV